MNVDYTSELYEKLNYINSAVMKSEVGEWKLT